MKVIQSNQPQIFYHEMIEETNEVLNQFSKVFYFILMYGLMISVTTILET